MYPVVWIFCHLFGHEAKGLIGQKRNNMRDTVYCGCGKREFTATWFYSGYSV